MRLVMVAILTVAAWGSGVSATRSAFVPFEGRWVRCEAWQGAEISEYRQLKQRRRCG